MYPSPTNAVDSALARIEADNDRIRAFVSVADRGALEAQAAAAAQRWAEGRPLSPLDGVPIGVKDNIDTADLATTFGSALYAERQPIVDAPAVARLRAAGAVIVGKTNLTELACGTEGRNEHFGDVVNPAMPDRFPGGSSSGSAAAVAAGMVPMAVGSDTSCSIRNPAASCGVVGLKPTQGRVSNHGVSVCNKLLDHVGPMTATCEHAAAMLAVIQDPGWPDPVVDLAQPEASLRIGILGGPFVHRCGPEVSAGLAAVVAQLQALGHQLTDVDLGVDLAEADDQVNVLCRDMLDAYGADVAQAPPELVGDEVRYWFDHYGAVSDAGYADGLSYRQAARETMTAVFDRVDVLVCPTARTLPARASGAGDDDPDDEAAAERAGRAQNCSIWSLTGVPSLSVPVRAEGAPPVGILLNGPAGSDGRLLALGATIEPAGR